jgi:hypothetical protein
VVVKRLNHGVATTTSGLWSKQRQKATQEPSEGRQQHEEPRSERVGPLAGGERLAVSAERRVPSPLFQQEALQVFEAAKERRSCDSCRCTDERSVQKCAPDDS